MLTVCTGHVLLVLTGFLVSTSTSSFFPFECLPSLFSLVLPSFILYDMVLYVWTLVLLFSTFLSVLFLKPVCL